jgi:hypothetical protein
MELVLLYPKDKKASRYVTGKPLDLLNIKMYLHVNIGVFGILLNKFASWRNFIAHQH